MKPNKKDKTILYIQQFTSWIVQVK